MANDAVEAQGTPGDSGMERAKLGILLYLENASKREHIKYQSQTRIVSALQSPFMDLFTPESIALSQTDDHLELKKYRNPFQVRDAGIITEALVALSEAIPPLTEFWKEGFETAANRGITEAGSKYLQEQMALRGTRLEEAAIFGGLTHGRAAPETYAAPLARVERPASERLARYKAAAMPTGPIDTDLIEKAKTFTLLYLDNAARLPQTMAGRTASEIEIALGRITIELLSQDEDPIVKNYKNPFQITNRKVADVRAVLALAIEELRTAEPSPLIQENTSVTSKTVGALLQITDAGARHVQEQKGSGAITLEEKAASAFGDAAGNPPDQRSRRIGKRRGPPPGSAAL